MKIQLVSDVHLEFGHEVHITNAGADVLVLAGDIFCARHLKTPEDEFMPRPIEYKNAMTFFEECAKEFPHVIYIMGNHEHYKHVFNDTASVIRETVAGLPNFHFLDNESVMIDGVKFIGATLWTDMNDNCPMTMDHLWRSMSDFHVIKYRDMLDSYFKFTPRTAYREHLISRMFIEGELDGETPTVIVTHHAPSYQSIHEMYKTDHYMNGGYASDLEYMMAPNVKLWCHGHTHNNFDYEVFGTRVVCNPLGYPGERRNPNKNLVLDVCEVETH
jgi:Icc-related predicted phosphoesterase